LLKEAIFLKILAAGTYTVHGRNESGCTVSSETGVVVAEPDAITFDMEIVDTSCGGEDDGQIIVSNIVGGTAPYTLVIAESGNVTSELGVDTDGFTFENLKPTYYSLTITDANGCVVEYINPNNTQNVISVQSPEDIQFVVVIVQPACNDGSCILVITKYYRWYR
jgi:large repetitive protein